MGTARRGIDARRLSAGIRHLFEEMPPSTDGRFALEALLDLSLETNQDALGRCIRCREVIGHVKTCPLAIIEDIRVP